MHGNWLRWCEVRGCKFIAPITKTQRLEADANLKAQYERINRQWEVKDIANA